MLIPSRFRPWALVAGVVLAGALLAPLASHGCNARGTSPEDNATATVAVAPAVDFHNSGLGDQRSYSVDGEEA